MLSNVLIGCLQAEIMKILNRICLITSQIKQIRSKLKENIVNRTPNFNIAATSSANNTYFNKKCLSLQPKPPPYAYFLQRFYSDNNGPVKLKLMEVDFLFWPNIIKTIKNWIYTSFIIRPYLDPDFSLTNFVDGAKLAAEVVSNRISAGKLDELDGLVTAECLSAVQKNLSLLSATQRHDLAVNKNDMYFSFPYEVGILFEDAKGAPGAPQSRFVEITVVHHVLKGSFDMIESGQEIPLNVGMHPEFKEKLFVLNYRFIRNYTKGVTDQWTLNVINHFKPCEMAAT